MAKKTFSATFVEVRQDMEGVYVALLSLEDGAILNIGLSDQDMANPEPTIIKTMEEYIKVKATRKVATAVPEGKVISAQLDVPDEYEVSDSNIKDEKAAQ